jgi:hypothetical protein
MPGCQARSRKSGKWRGTRPTVVDLD